MDGVDVGRSEKHEVTGTTGILRRDEERQALIDSAAKSQYAAVPARPAGSLSAGLLKVLDATQSTAPAGAGPRTPSDVAACGEEDAEDINLAPPESSAAAGGNQAQEADRTEGYDPNRIPASVFTPKPIIPTDWSIASNESLFSIQIGSCSFSKDHEVAISRSGELGSNAALGPVARSDPTDPPLPLSLFPGDSAVAAAADDPEQVAATESVNARAMDDVLMAVVGERAEDDSCRSSSIHRNSDASSVHSFAFPILSGASMSLRVVPEQQSQWQDHPEVARMASPRGVPKSHHNRWLQCFSCSLCHAE